MSDCEEQLHAMAAKYTALRKKYDALYTQSLEASRRRRKLEQARERIKELERLIADLLEALKAINKWLLDVGEPIDRPDLWNSTFIKAHDLAATGIAKAEGHAEKGRP